MRQRKSGIILWIGSVGGWTTGPGYGLYAATKHTMRALAGGLDDELRQLGLRSILVELGYFRTSFLTGDNRTPYHARIADYAEPVGEIEAMLQRVNGKQPGDPLKAVEYMVDIAHGDGIAKDKKLPWWIGLGSDYHATVKQTAEHALKQLEEWEAVATSTDLPQNA